MQTHNVTCTYIRVYTYIHKHLVIMRIPSTIHISIISKTLDDSPIYSKLIKFLGSVSSGSGADFPGPGRPMVSRLSLGHPPPKGTWACRAATKRFEDWVGQKRHQRWCLRGPSARRNACHPDCDCYVIHHVRVWCARTCTHTPTRTRPHTQPHAHAHAHALKNTCTQMHARMHAHVHAPRRAYLRERGTLSRAHSLGLSECSISRSRRLSHLPITTTHHLTEILSASFWTCCRI